MKVKKEKRIVSKVTPSPLSFHLGFLTSMAMTRNLFDRVQILIFVLGHSHCINPKIRS